jgi:Na+-transporting methylmalonyl-CoA/oxaloacetate decarboxylase gamma subunit
VNEPALWMLSINAFGAVLVLLSLLAVAVWTLTVVFVPPPAPVPVAGPDAAAPGQGAPGPASPRPEDAAVIAAIHATVRQVLPGGVVSRIEEAR